MSITAKPLWRYAAAFGIVALTIGAAEIVYRLTQNTRLSMVFLAGVLMSAFVLGSGPAYFAAVLAFLAYNFYLVDPRFTFSFGTPEDIMTLTVFLAVAMLTGHLTGRIRDEAKRAQDRARSTTALFAAARDFSASSDEAFIRERLVRHLANAAKGQAVLRDGGALVSEPPEAPLPRELLLEVISLTRQSRPPPAATSSAGDWTLRPLYADGASLGVAAWRPTLPRRLGSDEQTLLEILVVVGAAAIARARLASAKAEAEARARTEDLRNALLSSISHDLRTPLAAIMASASSLEAFGETFDAGTRKDLAATILQETERLNAFVANLLNMTRLESGALAVQKIVFSVPEVVARTVARRSGGAQRTVDVAIAVDLPEGRGDPVLFEQALGNVIENAMRYTPDGGAISVRALPEADGVVLEVCDEGPGVPEGELARIFQKFYRSPRTAQTPGTGLGLSITRGLMEGMGGSVSARNRADGISGLVVVLTLPAAA